MEALKNNLREYGMLMSLIAIMAFFQVMTDGTLMQPLNLTNLILQNSYIVIMALGMLLVIVLCYLAREHYGHMLGLLPYMILLLCPLMHFFGHHHGGHSQHGETSDSTMNANRS